MSPEDQEPTEDERREAEALVAALERGDADPPMEAQVAAPAVAVPDGLEVAALLRNARAPSAPSPQAEAMTSARVAPHLDGRRARHRRRARIWLATSVGVPAAAAVLLVFFTLPAMHNAPADRRSAFTPPSPSPDLLAAQAEAARGGGQAIAALDLKMRAYRRVFHDGFRNRRGGAP